MICNIWHAFSIWTIHTAFLPRNAFLSAGYMQYLAYSNIWTPIDTTYYSTPCLHFFLVKKEKKIWQVCNIFSFLLSFSQFPAISLNDTTEDSASIRSVTHHDIFFRKKPIWSLFNITLSAPLTITINSNKYWDFHHIYLVSNQGIKTQEITIWLRMLADSPKPEAYHSQPGLDKYSQHYVMLRLTTIIVMFTSITVIIFASMIIKSTNYKQCQLFLL